MGFHKGSDILQQPFTELGEVGVDLTGALGGVDHQGVLRVCALEQIIDRRVGDALGTW